MATEVPPLGPWTLGRGCADAEFQAFPSQLALAAGGTSRGGQFILSRWAPKRVARGGRVGLKNNTLGSAKA